MKYFALICLSFFLSIAANLVSEDSIIGFWKTVDDKTGKPRSLVAVYEYKGKYFGRLIATYKPNGAFHDSIYSPEERASGVVGEPYYSGLDFIYDLEKEGTRYTNGYILDPEEGRLYEAEVWREKNNLIVRGEILFFGKNQTWPIAVATDFPPGFVKPDLASLVPVIPQAK